VQKVSALTTIPELARKNLLPYCLCSKYLEIGNLSILDFDPNFGLKNIMLLQWLSNSNQQG
jgi:hypothetical protein